LRQRGTLIALIASCEAQKTNLCWSISNPFLLGAPFYVASGLIEQSNSINTRKLWEQMNSVRLLGTPVFECRRPRCRTPRWYPRRWARSPWRRVNGQNGPFTLSLCNYTLRDNCQESPFPVWLPQAQVSQS